MNDIKDLNIEKEISPLFDYSMNMFTKTKIFEILTNPLQSITEIIERQNILKGFAENEEVLNNYSYLGIYMNEVYSFLNEDKLEKLPKKKIKYKLFVSKEEKKRLAKKCTLLILLFHRLESRYLTRLKLDVFHEEYISNIKLILDFLSNFELRKYEYIIREKRLKDSHIIELTNRIKELRTKELTKPFFEVFFQFEAYLSLSFGISKHNFAYPNFTSDYLKLRDFYHPLLEKPVKNNLETNDNVIVLNGANMSGKSTFLKAVGLCVYLGHLGVGIPASMGEIPFYDFFSIEINKRDDISNGYSHFMTEIVNLKSAVEQVVKGKRCFAIFDELFSGTNVEDGFKICEKTIKGLSKYNNSCFFISTHIQGLKSVTEEKIANYYIDCKLIEDRPTFTYQVKKGWSDIKVGQILFEKEGLNKLLSEEKPVGNKT